MGRKWSNLNIPGALHFVTGNVLDRIQVFRNARCCDAFFEQFQSPRAEWPAKVISYVVMPDHFHFIVNPMDGNIRGFTGAFKSKLANKLIELTADRFRLIKNPETDQSHQVWQQSFKAVPLWSNWMIWQKINYIHNNPVKAKLVRSARDYKWSSFRAFYLGESKPMTVDQDWHWPDDAEKLSKAMKEMGWLSYHKRLPDLK